MTTPATCTAAGSEVYTCTVCGYVRTDIIPATGIHTDADKDGKCDNCGSDMPKPFTLTTAIHDGDQIVIVYAKTSMALTTTASGAKLQGVAVEPDGNNLSVENADIAVMTVDLSSDGTFLLTNAAGKYLTSGATGNGVSFTDEANDYSLWKMNESYDGSANHTVIIDNVNAKYNNNAQSLEYYSGFTTYGTKMTDVYQMKIYAISEEVSHVLSYVSNNNGTHNVVCSVAGCTENHNAENVDCEYEYTVVEPTYTETGYTTATCKYCGYSYRTNEVPVLDPVTLYPADSLEGATKVALYLPMTDNNDGFTGLLLSSDLASTQKYYLAAVQVNPDGSLANPAPAAIWNIAEAAEGKYSFTSGSKTLDSYISGTHYNICTNELDTYPDSALWTLTAAEGGFTLVSGIDVYLSYQWYASGSKHEFQGSSEGTFAFQLFTDAKKDAEISGYNLTLGNVIDPDGDGDLQVNFYVENVEESAIGDYYMTFKDGDGNVLLANAPLANVTGKGIRASLPVAMKDYDKKIVGTLFDKDGNELDSAALDSGVKTYIENAPQSVSNIVTALDSLCDFTKELLLDGYTSTKAAPADHTADLAAYAPTVSGEGQNASVYGISLLMKDKVALRAYIRQNSEVIAELDQQTVTGEATTSSTVFYYEIKGFTRLTLGTPHKLTVNCGQDAVSISNFSPLSYANIVVNDQNSDESLVKFANALYEYFAAVD